MSANNGNNAKIELSKDELTKLGEAGSRAFASIAGTDSMNVVIEDDWSHMVVPIDQITLVIRSKPDAPTDNNVHKSGGKTERPVLSIGLKRHESPVAFYPNAQQMQAFEASYLQASKEHGLSHAGRIGGGRAA